jgi:hypothetical protein
LVNICQKHSRCLCRNSCLPVILQQDSKVTDPAYKFNTIDVGVLGKGG